jgi:hypothetical protein
MESGTNSKLQLNPDAKADNPAAMAAALERCCSHCCGPLEPGANQTVWCSACNLTFGVIPMGDGSVALQRQEKDPGV